MITSVSCVITFVSSPDSASSTAFRLCIDRLARSTFELFRDREKDDRRGRIFPKSRGAEQRLGPYGWFCEEWSFSVLRRREAAKVLSYVAILILLQHSKHSQSDIAHELDR